MNKKQRSSTKKASSSGNMGRVVFYCLALVVGCCAVAVVLFETEAGLELVAKVRGSAQSGRDQTQKSTQTSSASKTTKERDFAGESSETRSEDTKSSPEQDAVPDGDSVLGTERDTSSKVADHLNEESKSGGADQDNKKVTDNVELKDDVKLEHAEETKSKDNINVASEDDTREDEPGANVVGEDTKDEDEKEAWESIEEKLDEDDKDSEHKETSDAKEPVLDDASDEPQPKKTLEEKSIEDGTKETVNKQAEVNDEERRQHEVDDRETRQEEEKQEVVNDNKEKQEEVNDEEVAQEKVNKEEGHMETNNGEEQEDTITIGDSLQDLENQRSREYEEAESQEPYEPIAEPEGPPIDEHPLRIQHGLRGDYGGKECKDENVNCHAWAKIGECDKNPVWMLVNCKKSCNVCSCSDMNVKCREWSRTGECQKNPQYMNKNCMRSCGKC